jgi:hypothetical protein
LFFCLTSDDCSPSADRITSDLSRALWILACAIEKARCLEPGQWR